MQKNMANQKGQKRSGSSTLRYLNSSRAREGACITCGRGDIPLDAGHFRRRECMATRFDYRNVAGQCKKENRFEGGKPSKFGLATGKGTQRLFQSSTAKEELGQLTRSKGRGT